MPERVAWYAEGVESRTFTCRCSWSGVLGDMSHEYFHELVEYSCPECDAHLVLRSLPKLKDVRESASKGE